MKLNKKQEFNNLSELKVNSGKTDGLNQKTIFIVIILALSLLTFFIQKGFLGLIENTFNQSEGLNTLFVESSVKEKYNTLKNIELTNLLNYLNIESLYLFLLNIPLAFNLSILFFIENKKILISDYKSFLKNIYVILFKLIRFVLFLALPIYLYLTYTGSHLNEELTICLFIFNIQLSSILMISLFLFSIYSLLKISKEKNKLNLI